MSVLCKTSDGWVIDHNHLLEQSSQFSELNELNKSDPITSKKCPTFKAALFDIQCPFMFDSHFENWKDNLISEAEGSVTMKRKKRKSCVHSDSEQSELHKQLLEVYENLLLSARSHGYLTEQCSLPENNNVAARNAGNLPGPGDSFAAYAETVSINEHLWNNETLCIKDNEELRMCDLFHRYVTYKGDNPTFLRVNDASYLIPPQVSFLMSDFKQLLSNIHTLQCTNSSGYDLIVIDYPWSNKSVKRKKSYSTLNEDDLLKLPLLSLAAPECILLLWVTNKLRCLDFVKNELFPACGVTSIKQWHWIKVTVSGTLVCEMDSPTKKPYETVLLGRLWADPRTDNSDLPDSRVLLSVPCSLHSKKPPLIEVLKEYLPEQPKCLELFGRNLYPGWVTWGHEVLKHQHLDYYEVT